MKLTILQKRCCDIYHSMKHLNQAQAYILASGKCRGKAAESAASRMLSNVKCLEYLEKLGQRATARAEKSADDVIRELEKMGFSNIKHYLSFSKKGVSLKNSEELTEEQLACVAEVSESISGKGNKYLRFKLHDKKAALELLGKRFKLFTEKFEGTMTLAGALHKAMTGDSK